MGFAEMLTLILVVLKLLGVVNISWLAAFSPIIVFYAFFLLVLGGMAGLAILLGGKKYGSFK